MTKPYKEDKISSSIKLRYFSKETDSEQLKWHYDEEDRKISVMGNTDWKFQFDDKLPIDMNQDIIIPKGVMHRIIKGKTDLNIIIKSIVL